MADPTGNDPKPGETRSGAVKPPVLDLKAREAAPNTPPKAEKPEAAAQGKPDAKAEPKPAASKAATGTPPKPAPATSTGAGFPIAATLAGGVLGLAAAYGLAWAGLWPAAPVTPPAPDARLTSLSSAIPELQTVTETTQSELAALNQRVATLETTEAPAAVSAPADEPVDLTPLEEQVAALSARLDSLAGTPADSTDTEALRTDLAALQSQIGELGARIGTAEAGLRDLNTITSETSATLASQPTDIGAVLQLPLILSGFETAFATGRPYETELASLRSALPDAAVPTAIANNAATGLVRPDVIAARLAEVLPAMLAGKPANPEAQWQDGALDWFASAIALRPTGEIAGDTPEAVMSRLEGAVARRDFMSAETLLAALPQPMQAAGGDLPSLIAQQAEAARFLDALRASALTGEALQ